MSRPDAEPRVALLPVYAIEVRPGRYEPRSKALPTATMPKLFAKLGDAERVMHRQWRSYPSARVVKFELREVKEEA